MPALALMVHYKDHVSYHLCMRMFGFGDLDDTQSIELSLCQGVQIFFEILWM